MKHLSFKFNTRIEFTQPVAEHDFKLRCIPQQLPEQQLVTYTLTTEPSIGEGSFARDSFGNTLYWGRIPQQHSVFCYGVRGKICRDDTKKEPSLPMACLKYPSELTSINEEMKTFLKHLPLDGAPYTQAQLLSRSLHDYFQYIPGSTNISTNAIDAFSAGSGVCQDYAHVFIALARELGIPARYVSGLTVGEGFSHAWVEIWQNGFWYGLDPTRNRLVNEEYIKLCTGRDFNDCPIERGRFFGQGSQKQTVWMEVKEEK